MSVQNENFITISDTRGGQNSVDAPSALANNEVQVAINVDWHNSPVGRKRGGAALVDMTGSTMDSPVRSLHRHVATSDDTQAELWAVDKNNHLNRLSRAFRATIGTFAAVINTGIWTPTGNVVPSAYLSVGQRVKIDGNNYTVSSANNTAFTTVEHNGIAYTANNVQPEGALWSGPGLVDNIIGEAQATGWASVDSKLGIANRFNTDNFGKNRFHYWDGSTVRRAGIGPSLVAPTANNSGSGTYAANTHFYRTRWIAKAALLTWGAAIGAPSIQVTQAVLTRGDGTQFASGFASAPVTNTTFTVTANLTVTVYAAAAGGGGCGANALAGSTALGSNVVSRFALVAGWLTPGSNWNAFRPDVVGSGGVAPVTVWLEANTAFGGSGGNWNAFIPGTEPVIEINGGAGGGGGAANNSGITVTLLTGKTYTYHVGSHGVGGINSGTDGDETFLHNDTDGVYVFRFAGGKGASLGTHGAGGTVTTGTGVAGGAGGDAGGAGASGAAGGGGVNGSGGGGGGGWGIGGAAVHGAGNGGSGGGQSPEAGQADQQILFGYSGTQDGTVFYGGRGGMGGGVPISVSGLVNAAYGAGGYGAGGRSTGDAVVGGNGQDGVIVFSFSPQTWRTTIGGFDSANNTGVWTLHAGGTTDPSSLLVIGQHVLIDSNTYTVASVNSTAFTTNELNPVVYSNQAVLPADSLIVRRSEPSPSVSFAANGTSIGVAVTRPVPPGDTETHWELEASMDDATYWKLAEYPKLYLTALDKVAPSNVVYANGTFDLSDGTGTYNLQKSYKFIASDQNRLLGFGSWDSNDKQNRIEYSAVLGSLNIGDIERVDASEQAGSGGFIDLDENDSGAPTGLVGPVFGSFFAFKINQFWKLTPTGNSEQPYTVTALSKVVGAVPRTVVVGEDEAGNPALYWHSLTGAYRYLLNEFGIGRLEFIGKSVQDRIIGPTSQMVFTTSDSTVVDDLFLNHSVFYPKLRQVWFYVLTSVSAPHYTKFVFNIGDTAKAIPSGWSIHNGVSAEAVASSLFSTTVGASMSHELKPYVGDYANNSVLYECDTPDLTDAGTAYRAYITSRTYAPGGMMRNATINRSYVLATAAANLSLTLSVSGDYGVQADSANADFSPVGSETRRCESFDIGVAEVAFVDITVGDESAVASAWSLDAIAVEALPKEVKG